MGEGSKRALDGDKMGQILGFLAFLLLLVAAVVVALQTKDLMLTAIMVFPVAVAIMLRAIGKR